VGHTSKSSGLLHVKASRARVSQFASKLVEVRRRVVHVAHRGGYIRVKLNTNESMQWATQATSSKPVTGL
jgi:hypothetical protein